MVDIGIAELSKNPAILDKLDSIATIVNKKNKEVKGYFIPKSYDEYLNEVMENIEKSKKIELLKRVAKASKKDVIGDGAVADGIE